MSGTRRRGQTLILMFFMMIALIGVMALTLDFGFVLLARRQMQTGVNAAALEGARDIGGAGRENARDVIRSVYDGNGGGSAVNNRFSFVYRPDPQLNVDNEVHGDLVAGRYDPAADHGEGSGYTRADLIPDASGDAFLARLRRTHDPDSLDAVAGVSSRGGGLPLMIGHLAWFAATPPDADYSIRRDGVTVRATAIANQSIAMRVWPTASVEVYGAIAFAVRASDLGSAVPTIQTTAAALTTVGQAATLIGSGSPRESGYLAVIDSIDGTDRVVGFTLHSGPGDVRLPNASTRMQDAWGVLGGLTASERSLIEQSQDVIRPQLLKVPALVRSVR